MKYDDENYTLKQRRDYWGKWGEGLFAAFFVVGLVGLWRLRPDSTQDNSGLDKIVVSGTGLCVVICLALAWAMWAQDKKVKELDKKIVQEKAEAKKKRESGQN